MDAIIVKIGGSLALHPENLKILCIKLSELSKKHNLLVVPGGGEFADVARDLDKRFSLSNQVSHRMAILGMDQYGFLLSDLIAGSQAINQLCQVQKVFSLGKMPIFLPSNLLLDSDPLENSWEVTSDSIAVYVASQLQITKVVLITDVDGIFTCDPKNFSGAQLINELSAKQLDAIGKRTSVDTFLPKLLAKMKISCFVVNGLFPQRVASVLDGKKTVCTLID